MHTRRLAMALAIVAVGVLGVLPAGAAEPNVLTADAFVQNQQCLGGDFVQVTLSATINSSSATRSAWDTNNDGIRDTPISSNPTVVVTYPDETSQTATIFVRNREGERTRDSVTFTTLRCP